VLTEGNSDEEECLGLIITNKKNQITETTISLQHALKKLDKARVNVNAKPIVTHS